MIDVSHQINAVRRQAGTRTLEAGQARVVTISQVYRSALEDLWDACTNPERIPRWFLPVTGDLRVGGRYQLEGNAGGEVLSCEPPRQFSATWEYGGQTSWIEVRLTEESQEHVRFTLDHISHEDDEQWAQFGPGAAGVGWDLAMIGLTLHLQGQAPPDPQEVAKWMASADGLRFVQLSSQQWGEANQAAGVDPAQARDAAARTTAFYTGTEAPA